LFSIKKNFGIFIKFGEIFSLGSLLNKSQTYQGNPCGIYPDLSSFAGSGVIQISVACIKRSTPSQDHITAYDEIKYLSFGLGVNDEHMVEQALTFYKVRTSFDLLILNLLSIYLHMF